ncbi:MAG: hypothetical protein QXJ34_00330 [Candidatus Pacearchaeota archaeon]
MKKEENKFKNKFKLLSKKEEKEIMRHLKEYGLTLSHGFVLLKSENKIFIAPKQSLNFLDIAMRAGFYLGKLEAGGFRLSFDATQLFAKQAKHNMHNTLELTRDELVAWMQGKNIKDLKNLEEGKSKGKGGKGFVILKHGDDFLGCGLLKDGKLLNYVPKERRIKIEM